jgi:hypothetical protein
MVAASGLDVEWAWPKRPVRPPTTPRR